MTVAELLRSCGRPLPSEAAALVLGVCAHLTPGPRQVVAAAISPSSVFLDADGSVSVAGGNVAEDDQTVSLLGHLLLDMLRSGGSARPAARLEALALRAAATSAESGLTAARFASEVRRFAPEDPAGAVKALFDRWRRGGEREPASQDVPETIRRLLPEADLAAMAGLTPTLHGPGMRAGFLRAGRRLVLTGAAILLLSAAGASYYIWGDRDRQGAQAAGRPANARVQPAPARELLPGGTPAVRPLPQGSEKETARPRTAPKRIAAGPD